MSPTICFLPGKIYLGEKTGECKNQAFQGVGEENVAIEGTEKWGSFVERVKRGNKGTA